MESTPLWNNSYINLSCLHLRFSFELTDLFKLLLDTGHSLSSSGLQGFWGHKGMQNLSFWIWICVSKSHIVRHSADYTQTFITAHKSHKVILPLTSGYLLSSLQFHFLSSVSHMQWMGREKPVFPSWYGILFCLV